MAKPTKGSATSNNNNKKKPSNNNKKKTSSSKNNASSSALKKKWYHTLDQFITETNHMLQLEKSAEEEEALNDTRMKWIEIVNVQSTLNGKYMVQFKFKANDSSSSNSSSNSSSSSSLYSMKSGQSIQIRMGASKDNPIIGKAINGITTNNTMTYDSSSHSSNSNSNSSSNTRSNTVTTTTDSGGVINSAIMDDFIEEWWESSKLQLIRVPDDVTHKRYTFTLNQKLPQFYNHPIVHTCFTPMNDQDDDDDVDDNNNNNNSKNSSSSSSTSNDSETREKQGMIEHYMNQDLNQEQKDVVQWSLYQCQSPICCILGPPGTGKTTTLIEIIQQAVSVHRYKVLVCAPSNTAVDNLVTRLSRASRNNNKLKNKVRMIRMGHPARLHDDVTRESLDYVISHGDSAKIVREMRAEIQDVLRALKRPRRNNSNSSGSNTAATTTTTTTSRKELVNQLKMLRKDLKKREKLLIQEELRHAQVILCTLTGADDYQLFKSNVEFDLVIVDEAAQSVEIANWIALLKGKRAILAGDPFQLPPTILSTEAQSCGLGVTLFERLYQYYGSKLTRMLTTQYRMHQDIMQWSSQEFYKGQLKAGTDEIAEHLLCDMPLNTSSLDAFASVSSSSSSSLLTHEKVEETDETSSPLFMIDTGGCGMEESSIEQGESSYNMHEVSLVKHHVKALSDAGVKDYQISIISPYMAQVIALRDALRDEHPFIEVNTVDGFQGRENECVIISMVRSNCNGEVGFLADERRTNVAITRAKRHVCVVCDTTTLRTDSFLSRMASYFSDNADVRSAEDYDV